jgi:hypothetical protein
MYQRIVKRIKKKLAKICISEGMVFNYLPY